MRLEESNKNINFFKVTDEEFVEFGNVKNNIDTTKILEVLKTTDMPDSGNKYVASDMSLENCKSFYQNMEVEYGGMPIQIGYCNGYNSTINGLEYHKCSEYLVSLNDIVLFLGNIANCKDGNFAVEDGKFFIVPANSMIELYQTTMHLSPIKTSSAGYQTIIVLAKGTNTELNVDSEDKLLFKKNKWMIAHPDREILVKQGVYKGLIGENIEIKL